MPKTVLLVSTVLLATLGAAPASAAPLHLHCMTNASGQTHAIGMGVTERAPHDPAFDNFHRNVHFGAFAGRNPHTITIDLTQPYSCS